MKGGPVDSAANVGATQETISLVLDSFEGTALHSHLCRGLVGDYS